MPDGVGRSAGSNVGDSPSDVSADAYDAKSGIANGPYADWSQDKERHFDRKFMEAQNKLFWVTRQTATDAQCPDHIGPLSEGEQKSIDSGACTPEMWHAKIDTAAASAALGKVREERNTLESLTAKHAPKEEITAQVAKLKQASEQFYGEVKTAAGDWQKADDTLPYPNSRNGSNKPLWSPDRLEQGHRDLSQKAYDGKIAADKADDLAFTFKVTDFK